MTTVPKPCVQKMFDYVDSLDELVRESILWADGEVGCWVVLASGDHVSMLLKRDGTFGLEIVGGWDGCRDRHIDIAKVEFIVIARNGNHERIFPMPWRQNVQANNVPSGLFYPKSGIEMKLGDKIRIKRLFRRSLEGQVTFIARGKPDPISDPDQIYQWGYECIHPGMKVTLYQPAKTPPDRKFAFVSRYDLQHK